MRSRIWEKEHKDKQKEYSSKHYQLHKEEIKEKRKKYYQEHKEESLKYQKEYYKLKKKFKKIHKEYVDRRFIRYI